MTRTSPKHAPRAPFAVLVLGLFAGGLCALLALNTASAANEVRRHDLAAADESVAAQLVQLNNDRQASAAPGNLAAAAGALGMVPAGNPAFLEINANGTVRVLGSAAPATAPPVYVAPTKKKTPKKTAKTTAKTKSATKAAAHGKKTPAKSPKTTPPKRPTSTPRPTPTPTPTPESTLPGGTR
jgi:hypothetical protein